MGDTSEENARLEVCLALTNKFQAPADDMTDLNKLFIKTKELCVSIIPFLNGKFFSIFVSSSQSLTPICAWLINYHIFNVFLMCKMLFS